MQKLEDKRTYWEGLSDKVNAINDARTALDALRHEHKEEMKRRKEEAERQRQILVRNLESTEFNIFNVFLARPKTRADATEEARIFRITKSRDSCPNG